MSMNGTLYKTAQKLSGIFLLTAFAVLSFFPKLTLAASKPTCQSRLKVSCSGFQYDNDTAKLYLKLKLKNTSSYTITKVRMEYEIPIMEDGTITQTFSVNNQSGKNSKQDCLCWKNYTAAIINQPKVKCLSFWYRSCYP